jgi:hypothetical protein
MTKAIFEFWEVQSTPVTAHGKGNIGGEPKIHIFGVIGQEDRIDLVQEGVNTLHIEPLRLADGPDIPRKCSTTLVK